MPIIQLYAGLRKTAGVKTLTIEGETVGEIIAHLVEKIPVLDPVLIKGNTIQDYVTIAVNGHNISFIDGLNTPVKPDDEIGIFPPLAGG